MFGIDLTTLIIIVIAFIAALLLIDLLFAGGGVTGAMQCGAAMMSSPYGWVVIVALVLGILAVFGVLFGR